MALASTTRLCALLGDPVAHSFSPALHNAAFAERGLDFAYLAFRVTDLQAAVAGVRGLGLAGLSVTIPHKETILPLLDRVDDLAARIGAVNTVVNEAGVLVGYNTDAAGVEAALAEAGLLDPGRPLLVCGAGGVARAVVFSIVKAAAPTRILLFDPLPGKAALLAEEVRVKAGFTAIAGEMDPGRLAAWLAEPGLIVNASPLGMHPREAKSPVPPELLAARHGVFDVVYTPAETSLIRAARAAGCRVATGDRMFVKQAALQFRLWTGVEAPEALMARVLAEKLGT